MLGNGYLYFTQFLMLLTVLVLHFSTPLTSNVFSVRFLCICKSSNIWLRYCFQLLKYKMSFAERDYSFRQLQSFKTLVFTNLDVRNFVLEFRLYLCLVLCLSVKKFFRCSAISGRSICSWDFQACIVASFSLQISALISRSLFMTS